MIEPTLHSRLKQRAEQQAARTGPRTRRGHHRALRRDYVLVGIGGAIAAALSLIALTARAYLATTPPSPPALLAAGFFAALAAAAITLVAYRRHRATLELALGHKAERGILRVERVIERAQDEERLLRDALAAMASETCIDSWAVYLRRGTEGSLVLAGSLAPPAEAPGSLTLAEAIALAENPDAAGPSASAALTENGQLYGLIRCWSSPFDPMGAEERAHVRWMAGAFSAGLSKLRDSRAIEAKALVAGAMREFALVVDAEGRIEDGSPEAVRALGLERSLLLGSHLRDHAQVATGEPIDRLLTNPALDEDDDPGLSVLWFGSEGAERRAFEVRITRLAAARDNRSGLLLLGRDATARLEQDAAHAHHAETLKAERECALVESRRLAEAQVNQLNFFANASHELRTPLNAVIGFATLIEQGVASDDEERTNFARSIRESAEHLLSVLNDILDLAKMESGQFNLDLQTGDLRPTLQSAVDSVSPLAYRKGLNVRLDLPIDPVVLNFDPARMRQVFLNLLGNAVKFTDIGEIRIGARRKTDRIQVQIEDTGAGIAPEDQARLFARFAQAHAGQRRRGGGTGLGLAITKGLVEGMNGVIEIQSDGIGFGTRVRLDFPAVAPEVLLARTSSAPAAASGRRTQAGGGDSEPAGRTEGKDGEGSWHTES